MARPRLHPSTTPGELGFYWATHRRYGWRTVVELGRNGHGQVRVFCCRQSGTFDVIDFQDWYGPLQDTKEAR